MRVSPEIRDFGLFVKAETGDPGFHRIWLAEDSRVRRDEANSTGSVLVLS